MKILERYFNSAFGASRAWLLTRVLLITVALDIWLLMISHAGRYGAGAFNVGHFPVLDAILPLPTPGQYIGVLTLAALIATTMAFTGVRRVPAAALFLLYTLAWSMSMIDSFQHHYFISLVLLCLVFFPRSTTDASGHDRGAEEGDGSDGSAMAGPYRHLVKGTGFHLLAVSTAILYMFTAIAKMDSFWIAGYTLSRIAAQSPFASLVAFAECQGMSASGIWTFVSIAAIAQELILAGCYLVAAQQDHLRSRFVGALCLFGFLLSVLVHAGAEAMNLQIGWFSFYMISLGFCYLLPLSMIDGLVRLASWPARWIRQVILSRGIGAGVRRFGSGLAYLAAAGLLLAVGKSIELPGVFAACAIFAALLVGGATWSLFTRQSRESPSYPLAAAVAALAMWLAVTSSNVRWDYYRYLGGDLVRRNELEAALRVYETGERYAPPGESRASRMEELRRELGR